MCRGQEDLVNQMSTHFTAGEIVTDPVIDSEKLRDCGANAAIAENAGAFLFRSP